MNKVAASTIRAVLQVGGAILATSGLLPAQCTITDPVLSQIAGIGSILIGTVWSAINAKGNQRLVEAVNASPALPSATEIEKGLI